VEGAVAVEFGGAVVGAPVRVVAATVTWMVAWMLSSPVPCTVEGSLARRRSANRSARR
jgi:hypothetical protein